MFTKHNLLKVFSIIAILAMMFSNTQPPVAQAQSGGGGESRKVTIRGGDGINRKVNARSGKVNFLSPESGRSLSAAKALGTSIRPQDPGLALAKRFAPEFGVKDAARDLVETKRTQSNNGRLSVRYQQTYQGIPVMGGELIVNTDDNGDLYSMNGEVSPDISLSTQPIIHSATAKETALQEVAKSYQKNPEDFIATEPALWIYDESLLKESTRPVELVWRMNVTAKDNAMPVRESVLVNAQNGEVSLHFNQIDTEWKPDIAPTSTPEPPQPTEPPVATGVPESVATPSPLQAEQSGAEISTGPSTALATTWYVASTGDDLNTCSTTASPCASINGALGKAQAGDTINVSSGLYQGSAATNITVTKSITILGGWNSSFNARTGYSILDGAGTNLGIFWIQKNTVLERFVIRNGTQGINVSDGTTCPVPVSLVLRQSSVINMSNGGIRNCGTVTIENSTLSSNQMVAVDNFTGTVTIKNSTIVNNSSGGYGQFVGGGIYNVGGNGSVTLQNSIVTGNTGYGGIAEDCGGTFTSNGQNIIGTTIYCYPTLQPSDKVGVDPKLGPQLPNGYFPLLSSSPAIDSGASCLSTDQRGVTRPQGVACDIGAYEYATPGSFANLLIVGGNGQRTAPNYIFHLPLTIAPVDSQDNLVPNVTVNFAAPGSGVSAKFSSTGNNSTSAISNGDGLAISSALTANGQSGAYNVTASASGVTSVNFNLQNSGLYVATTGNNANSCTIPASPCATLNGAIGKAASEDVILVASGTYTDTGDEVALVNKNVTLAGGWNNTFTTQNGTTFIDGQGARRGISINYGLSSFIDRFTIQNGYNIQGGGLLISSGGTTVISNSTIRNNNAGVNGSGPYGGGGIDNSGTLTINNSTVNNNKVTGDFPGSGIRNGRTLFLNNSTVSGNNGGGGGISNGNVLIINNSTITRNRPSGINNLNGSNARVTFQNSIIAKNGPTGDCQTDPSNNNGVITSQGHNLIGNGTGCTFTPATGDLIGTSNNPINLYLSLLQDNGGSTWTYALRAGSPAIDAGNPATCLATDQRGVARPVGLKCDIGAYEGSIAWTPVPVIETYTMKDPYILQVDPPGIFVCDEGDLICSRGDADAKSVHTYTIGTYNLYVNKYTRDSIDNKGMAILSSVHYCDHYSCPIDNAFWNGTQMVYGDAHGYALADDVVAHELTHGVTQYESDLFYYYQSGAINESLSDVFGEYYDQTNGLGNDAPDVKWKIGEDVSGLGAIRSMSDPTLYGDPDRMSSPNYFTGGDDNGGVHWNSGVNNKAVYLMVDGSPLFNGKTVTGIGWDKVGAIYYEANANLLTSASDYSDLYYAVQQACTNLIGGPKGITSTDCVQVKNALDAVEMNSRQRLGNVDDPSFEYSYLSYYPYWEQSSTNFYTPLCTVLDCGNMGGTAKPRTGSVWTWFGGTPAYEAGSVSQVVYFPRGYPSLKLKFYLWIGRADKGSDASDKFVAQVDGVTLFTANATQKSLYSSYKQVSVDMSGFAMNSLHTITFSSVTSGQIVNFNLDDVSLGDNTLQISGNAGTADALLQYSTTGVQRVTADGNGNYSLFVPFNWSGTVTPYKKGYTFTPASKSYSNVQSNLVNQNYTAQVCMNCADVDVSIGLTSVANYSIAPAPSTVDRYAGIVDGPVKITSTTGGNIFTSQQAVYGNSLNELMGYPADQFVTEYWFPWYDQVNMGTWILVGNPSTTQHAYVDIYIGGVKRADDQGLIRTYAIPPGGNVTPQFPGVVSGPVRVVSVTGSGTASPIKIFASERSIYASSFNEVMGYPASQFVKEYWFPWYDQVNMGTWILVGNPSTTQHAYVDIYIGGVKVNDTVGSVPYDISPGGNVTPQFPGIVNGPVRVVSVTGPLTASPLNIFTSERSIYASSFNEVMGTPLNQFTTDYYYTWYDNIGMSDWILVGNPSSSQHAYVDIYIGGVKVNNTPGGVPYDILPNGNLTPQFTLKNGPVHVVSVPGSGTPTALPIFTSERVIYKSSFNEMMGYPANQLTSEYWFTWYDNVNMKTDLLIGKP